MTDIQLPPPHRTIMERTDESGVWEQKRVDLYTADQVRAAVEDDRQRGEPVAWMHDEVGRVDVIHQLTKELWINAGQYNRVEHYTIPLYTRPPIDLAEVMRLCDQYAGAMSLWTEDKKPLELVNAARAALAAYLEGKE